MEHTTQPSGKLARWEMAIQELDLEMVHRPGKKNVNVDGLSQNALPFNDNLTAEATFGVIATIH